MIERYVKIAEKRNLVVKSVLTALCMIGYHGHLGFYEGCSWINHIAYVFCHVNVFHAIVNLFILWEIKNKIPIFGAFLVSISASFLPMYNTVIPTMGLSGFLFASFGILWGRTGRWKDAFVKAMPFIVLTMIIPRTNGLLHLWCFWIGYILGFLQSRIKLRSVG